jgi:predicted esterase
MKKIIILLIVTFLFLPVFAEKSVLSAGNNNVAGFMNFDIKQAKADAYKAYTEMKYDEAVEQYLLVLQHNITDSNSIYNLACCYGLLGNNELASVYLHKAYEAGFKDINHIKNDRDFTKVKDSDVYKKVLQTISEKEGTSNEKKFKQIYVPAASMQPGYISLPKDFDVVEEYTLLVGLHGFGGNANNFLKKLTSVESEGLILAAPTAPYALPVGKDIGFSWNLPTEDFELEKQAGALSEKYILDFVNNLKSKYKIKDVYLLGFSQGAYFSFYLGTRHPDVITGIIPFGGGYIDYWEDVTDFTKAQYLQVFVVHGTKDNVVKFEESTKAVEILEKHGLKPELTEFNGAHSVPGEMLQKAYDWIRQ